MRQWLIPTSGHILFPFPDARNALPLNSTSGGNISVTVSLHSSAFTSPSLEDDKWNNYGNFKLTLAAVDYTPKWGISSSTYNFR